MKFMFIIALLFSATTCHGNTSDNDNKGSGTSINASYMYKDVTATHVPSAPSLHGLDAVMIDVDKDGDLDVVLAVEYGANRLYVNDGSGHLTYKEGVFGNRRSDAEHVRSADFNNDGIMDILFISEDDETHDLFFGDGRGGFADMSHLLPGKSQANGVAVGDVNGDGLPDIVLGNTTEGSSRTAQTFLWLNDPEKPGNFKDVTSTYMPQIDV